ncbi:sulfide:quinone oxidoreductase, mitochondrial-like [Dreissena polymorpha]|uniref:Sulfide:quinone oxidoreductase, mitochondrial n=1 Tax=Dreissena polymorpha TaxID=45954 RepID=A0A9D4L8D2_DREPO|nr:sulfide:quinone oxidoreductase, mitochondrial-like [Dreissena polymorpha]KAH3853128.1 hypothetical protein DPMN_095650 [Dreissena polymorpha]
MTTKAVTGACVLAQFSRSYATQGGMKHYKVLVAGGGTGGLAVGARARRSLGAGQVAVVEPSKEHFYQPLWTLVGAGMKRPEQSMALMKDLVPSGLDLFEQGVREFDPDKNNITLTNGEKISYDYLVVALGIQLDLNKVEGLVDALKEDKTVCTNYHRDHVKKTFPAIQSFKGGNAIFTFPNTPIKCAGAPQKIMYLAEDYWKRHGVKDRSNIMYQTALSVIFGVPKYAASLMKVVERKNIVLNLRRSLTSVDHMKKTATFDLLDKKGEKETINYDFLHVGPPQCAPDVLRNSATPLVDVDGFLDVNLSNCQHIKYPNIFGIGDCTNIPTSKTAAAVAPQTKIVMTGISEMMAGKPLSSKYNGYTSCPLITDYNHCILAEFGFNGSILETFPVEQGKERQTMFYLKKYIMPQIYWNMMTKGVWNGPATYRYIMHLGMCC